MDRNPHMRLLLWILPCDQGNRPLEHAEELTSGIHALDRTGRGLTDPVREFRRHAAELAPEVEVCVLDLGGTLQLDANARGDRD